MAFSVCAGRIAFRGVRPGTLSPFPTRAGLAPLVDGAGALSPTEPGGRVRSSSSTPGQDDGRRWTLLYQRDSARSTYPRALFGVSVFNLSYWTWYVADFTPSVNASARAKAALGQLDPETLELMLIDPNMGYVGFGIASAIFLGAYVYARQLVAACWAPTDTAGERSALAVATLRLPFLTQPRILQRTVYDPDDNNFSTVEDLSFTESELRAESSVEIFAPGELALSEEGRKHDAIVKFDGQVSKLRGHVSLKKENNDTNEGLVATLLQQRYLLDIEAEQEFMPNANPTLLHSLVLADQQTEATGTGRRRSARDGKAVRGKQGYRKRRFH